MEFGVVWLYNVKKISWEMIFLTKKFFAAILLGTMVFLTGCGDNSADNSAINNAQASPVAKNMPIFKSVTVNDEPVTNKIFSSKKITVVNIWGTFCPPCIAEMPALAEMARTLPDNAQIIGIVCDISVETPEKISDARKILQKANVGFVNIVPDQQLQTFMANVEVVPTTIFVNSTGAVVGNVILGADVKGYKNELEKLLKN